MRKIISIIGFCIFLTSCLRNSEPKFINQVSEDTVKYFINLSGSRITDYSEYVKDSLIEIVSYYIKDTIVERITRNSLNENTGKWTFYLGDNGFAEYIIDSSFIGYRGKDATIIKFEYENDFLVEIIENYQNETGEKSYKRIFKNENAIKIGDKSFDGTIARCYDTYEHYDTINKLDIERFSNGFLGIIHRDLVKKVIMDNECYKKGNSLPYREYSYELNDSGFVIKKIESFTPSFDSFDKEVIRRIRITLYEYNAR